MLFTLALNDLYVKRILEFITDNKVNQHSSNDLLSYVIVPISRFFIIIIIIIIILMVLRLP